MTKILISSNDISSNNEDTQKNNCTQAQANSNQKQNKEIILTPEVLIQIIKNNISPFLKEISYPIKVKGKLLDNKPRPAGGYHYLDVKGDGGAKIVIKLPIKVYEKTLANLPAESTITFEGIPSIEWNFFKNTFEILITVNKLLDSNTEESLHNSSRINTQNLLIKKAKRLYQFKIDTYLKNILKTGKKPKIVLITGTTAIVDEDVKTATSYAAKFYDFIISKINTTSPESLINELKKWADSDIDLIAIVRGGGEGLNIFNSIPLCLAALEINKPIVAALGHSKDTSYFDLFGADISFPVPASLGTFLKEIYDEVIAELEHKKAITELMSLINQKDNQIKELNNKLEELELKKVKKFQNITQDYTQSYSKEEDVSITNKTQINAFKSELEKLRTKNFLLTLGLIFLLLFILFLLITR